MLADSSDSKNRKVLRESYTEVEYLITGREMALTEKLQVLTDAAKYDVACTSSGLDRKGDGKSLGNCVAAGICHSFSGDGRCISLLKILLTNECIFDCKYCRNRRSNDVPRATFTPEEIPVSLINQPHDTVGKNRAVMRVVVKQGVLFECGGK